jgi:hypothetical protein
VAGTDHKHARGVPIQAVSEALEAHGWVFPDEAGVALESGNLIAAIKLLRDANPGLGLKEAKEALEGLQAMRGNTGADAIRDTSGIDGPRVPTVAEGDRGGGRILVVVAFVLLAVVAWWLFAGR